MRIRPATGRDAREAKLYAVVPGPSPRAHPRNGPPSGSPGSACEVADWRIRRMKTRWGTCNAAGPAHLAELRTRQEAAVLHRVRRRPRDGRIWSSPTHNDRFREILDQVMPNWRLRAEELNRTRLADEGWGRSLKVQ